MIKRYEKSFFKLIRVEDFATDGIVHKSEGKEIVVLEMSQETEYKLYGKPAHMCEVIYKDDFEEVKRDYIQKGNFFAKFGIDTGVGESITPDEYIRKKEVGMLETYDIKKFFKTLEEFEIFRKEWTEICAQLNKDGVNGERLEYIRRINRIRERKA